MEVAMVVVCGEVFGWAGSFLTKMSSIRLEWGIKWNYGKIGGVEIFLSICLIFSCTILLQTERLPYSLLWYVMGQGIGEFGMFASIEVLMIGRQMWWTSSYVSWHPIYLQGLRVIVWNGSWQKKGILLSVHFTISYMVLLLLFFLGKAFGRLRHPDVSLSFCG